MSHNLLTVIAGDSLVQSISLLETLALDNNKIRTVDSEAFINMTSLTDLDMKANNLESVPNIALQQLSSLKYLNLGENLITHLALPGSPYLQSLVLEQNMIRKIRNQGGRTSSIRSLNLRRNRLTILESEMFETMTGLETLLLDHNYLEDVNGVFSSISSLKNISISHNSLKWFDMAFFHNTIQAINISSNKIEEIGNYYKIFDGFSLQSLDLSYNRISYLDQHMLVVS